MAMPRAKICKLYQELQSYIGWTEADAQRIEAAAPLLETHIAPLIDDFYDEIDRRSEARRVITGGAKLSCLILRGCRRPSGRACKRS